MDVQFKEAFLKAVRSLEHGKRGTLFPTGPETLFEDWDEDDTALRRRLVVPTDRRMWALFRALERGWTVETLHELTNIDPWFLDQFREIVDLKQMAALGPFRDMTTDMLRTLKRAGFSDADIAGVHGVDESAVRQRRLEDGIVAAYKRIDTCAAEFESFTPYMYGSFEQVCEAEPTPSRKVIILGSGPNRIGQGIEFDYCCCHAVFGFREEGFETVMVNCNPETVSTDYDTADRLYFEPLTFEDVMAIVDRERSAGAEVSCVVQFGGQTPLKLALALQDAGVPILGTSPDSIDLAEDRKRFSQLLHDLGVPQPSSGTAVSREQAQKEAERIGYPVVVRPSYVLGGRGMAIVFDSGSLDKYMTGAVDVSYDRPVLIDRFLEDAFEFDVDAVADRSGAVVIGGIMEHIEEAGIHSGDSSCVVPPFMVAERHLGTIREYTRRIARALKVVGLMNIQYAIKDDVVYVLEVNPRSSRTVPYISKATGTPMAKVAARVAAGRTLAELGLTDDLVASGVFVKSPVFPFVRFPGVDTILGPEMKSTGEVMGGSDNFGSAFNKAMLGAGQRLPERGRVFISVNNSDKPTVLPIARDLASLGFTLAATRGTASFLRGHGLDVELMYKVNEGRPNVADHLVNRDIDMVINTPLGRDSFFDDLAVRRAATMTQVPCITTLTGATAAVSAIRSLRSHTLTVRSLQDYYAGAPDEVGDADEGSRRPGFRLSASGFRLSGPELRPRRADRGRRHGAQRPDDFPVACRHGAGYGNGGGRAGAARAWSHARRLPGLRGRRRAAGHPVHRRARAGQPRPAARCQRQHARQADARRERGGGTLRRRSAQGGGRGLHRLVQPSAAARGVVDAPGVGLEAAARDGGGGRRHGDLRRGGAGRALLRSARPAAGGARRDLRRRRHGKRPDAAAGSRGRGAPGRVRLRGGDRRSGRAGQHPGQPRGAERSHVTDGRLYRGGPVRRGAGTSHRADRGRAELAIHDRIQSLEGPRRHLARHPRASEARRADGAVAPGYIAEGP